MSLEGKSTPNRLIYDEAAEWLIEVREGAIEGAALARLDQWFRESPQHIRAYLELAAIWEDGSDPDLDRLHTIQELLELGRASGNIVPLKPASQGVSLSGVVPSGESDGIDPSLIREPVTRLVKPRSWFRLPRIPAAAAVAGLMVGASFYIYQDHRPTFSTELGEQRFVKLSDGSTVTLNAGSRVRIRFSARERRVDLVEGQAFFHVAKDAAHPFIVQSGSTEVRAVGTEFDVYRKGSGTVVTVVEGRVAVLSDAERGAAAFGLKSATQSQTGRQATGAGSAPSLIASTFAQAPNGAVLVDAGEQLTVGSSGLGKPQSADTTAATAWTQHELIFDSTPLSEVTTEFNRYNKKRLVIGSPAVRGIQITGVFSSADAAPLLRFLRAQRDLVVIETDEGIRIDKK